MEVDAELYGTPLPDTTTITTTTTTTTPTTHTTETATPTITNDEPEKEKREIVSFTLNFNKQNYPIEWPVDDTILLLKNEIYNRTRVPVPLQKLMFKGLVKENGKTLRELGIGNGAKLMLIGSTMTQVMEVNAPPQVIAKEEEAPKQEPLSDQKKHKTILEKGLPDNAYPGLLGKHEKLPSTPLCGIYNNRGTPVRLTFKVYSQELWIASSTSTQQIPFATIKSVQSEPIKGKEEYHIMSLQLGSSDNTKYFLYFVPAQFTKAIQNSIMGTFL